MTATNTTIDTQSRVAARLVLAGRVQGIGLRPSVARFADQLELAGYIANTLAGVEIYVVGSAAAVRRFEREFAAQLPAAAELSAVQSERVEPLEFTTFVVGPASTLPRDQTRSALRAHVPPDVVTCQPCLAEVRDKANRRHGYGLTSCTDCGPRYSILARMPYEREQTSMAGFELCDACRYEYESASQRRFHAQTNTCPDCGPKIWLRNADDQVVARDANALDATASALGNGRIVALRGLGGYQLLADATSQETVERLRDRKLRRGKPLAVMVSSLDAALRLAQLDGAEQQLLSSPAGPIVVATARSDAGIASSVTAGLKTIGLMLPTTPLHALLLDAVQQPLVCTSANASGDPLVYQAEAAFDELRGVADVWLEHDRPIRRQIDDSVVRIIAGRPVTLRLARGYAPLPMELETEQPLLALGGHQKTALALGNGEQSVLGPHVGDLDSVAARQRFIEHVAAMSQLYGIDRCQFVVDQHPEYFTTHWAEQQAAHVFRVQHHHAHTVAGMVQHGWLNQQVLGVAFDGMGYAATGTTNSAGEVWGGEFLLATAAGFERVGHLRPFRLAGGERAVREPWRVAVALVREAAADQVVRRLGFQMGDAQSLLPVLRSPRLAQTTTSAGRLFDGVAALILGIEQCQFEGQAAMLLESACDVSASGEYEIVIAGSATKQLDWRPLVRRILQDRDAGVAPGVMAMRFHRGLASAIFHLCRIYSSRPVVLGGGVFQNRVLVELVATRFAETDQRLGLPGLIPPNDGGLAAGQLAIAATVARQRRTPSCV